MTDKDHKTIQKTGWEGVIHLPAGSFEIVEYRCNEYRYQLQRCKDGGVFLFRKKISPGISLLRHITEAFIQKYVPNGIRPKKDK